MSTLRNFSNAAAAVLLLSALAPAYAHHSLTAEFDTSRTVEVTGTVTEMRWTNPHSWLHVDVTDESGRTQNWAIEFGTPNTLFRRGWTKADLPAGAVVKIIGYPPRDNSLRVSALDVTLPDGRTLFAGTRPDQQD